MWSNGTSWVFDPTPTANGAGVWTTTGHRTDRNVTGNVKIGGQGSSYNSMRFQGKVASFVSTSLMRDVAMPTDAEVEAMITDPIKWLADFKVGNTFRLAYNTSTATFAMDTQYARYATQVYLMGDGSLDSYPNGIRNEVNKADQVYTKLNFQNMAANDIENVTIPGLT